ncbi:hypothetical protein KEF85_08410 [Methylomonas paludis]|uniref:Uncharacterized protein n=1 Tax=Methylomonas paludis TaxID=1173101 RepID=A0A975R806_9GAMM|nr:hypothetical protein [Methylomonas paludis]QWF69407.1 hypothetical protein KEF85_08410 [Methylomonas paludis]
MNKLHLKDSAQEAKTKPVAEKTSNTWEVDATGKVLNYAGQFRAKIAELRENRQTAI